MLNVEEDILSVSEWMKIFTDNEFEFDGDMTILLLKSLANFVRMRTPTDNKFIK